MVSVLKIVDLHAKVEDKEVLKGLNLEVKQGEVHAIMGPNGSGKTSLAYVLMAHPRYKVTQGDILLDGQSILALRTDQRAKLGLFLGFQYPVEVPGLRFGSFLRTLATEVRGDKTPLSQFYSQVKQNLARLGFDESFLSRSLNEGFSGGEKKRAEIVQLMVSRPKFAVLDETDSGLDVDALKVVSEAINSMRAPEIAFILITHYQRILKYVRPDVVHILVDGRIVKSGDYSLAEEIERKGYESIKEAMTNA
ncbi:Fe-S cluster assembly ATPase SufC [Candidatus Marsarchaeota G2 archaeon ECH_B_SAG-G16]|jgi:Fe-S cluster assembly ATP-binding protein|uniref:Fe-S cluster assembly ATPase SufC n=4 Tax=Candidatus Marsarchaeota TaxID=1978152 RepID=A0A2R6ABC8_9ARCH|nr:MAG: Fe-S cluster assembly ATPase SufC [Candidatus Marsarchaeota G1 archaeon OSP_D]PSN88371.1 MAG: Fe-S cluster assembly ATPase SufC [Candidatus Marsarchaeota G1 archaeon OSP_C]PSN93354.1 MAG: Fe-S cluster assembly ATPase SufC [Candidatus Marsarchaeota G1 archaeon OSP_B]PSO05968.1 MAG: Fe-S cluster assembly ATPase SufC [Candidatus Marsarchaeota G2 archaeon ECH_B_SAG-G16]